MILKRAFLCVICLFINERLSFYFAAKLPPKIDIKTLIIPTYAGVILHWRAGCVLGEHKSYLKQYLLDFWRRESLDSCWYKRQALTVNIRDLPTRRVVASAQRLPAFSTFARRDVLLSAIGRLLLPALDIGTVYLLTSGLPRHSQHFVGSWKLIYFGQSYPDIVL